MRMIPNREVVCILMCSFVIFQLAECRSKDKKFTLLHYLVQLLEKHDPDLLHFHKDLTHISDCSELSIKGLTAEIEGWSFLAVDVFFCIFFPPTT